MTELKWHGDHEEWKRNMQMWDRIAGDRVELHMHEHPVSQRAMEVATAVFYYASDYNTLYRAPLAAQLHAWASIYDCWDGRCMEWLTVDLAIEAVHAHFAQSDDGRMLPAHVLQQATVIRLERMANDGA